MLNTDIANITGESFYYVSSREAIEPAFDNFADRFHAALTTQTFARLGLAPNPVAAQPLMHRFWAAMAQPFFQAFHNLLGGGRPERLRDSPIPRPLRPQPWPR